MQATAVRNTSTRKAKPLSDDKAALRAGWTVRTPAPGPRPRDAFAPSGAHVRAVRDVFSAHSRHFAREAEARAAGGANTRPGTTARGVRSDLYAS